MRNSFLENSVDGHFPLALAVVSLAFKDAKAGDRKAAEWLRSTGFFWLEVISGENVEEEFLEKLISKGGKDEENIDQEKVFGGGGRCRSL